jgi:hypothetical protein
MWATALDDATSTTLSPTVVAAQENSGTVTWALVVVLAAAFVVVGRRIRRIRRHGPGAVR